MSEHVRMNSDFLNLLLSDIDLRQKKALLSTINEDQTDVLSEIFYQSV